MFCEQGKEKILAKAEQIGRLQKEVGMKIPVDDYKETFHFGLMEVVFEWARGMVSNLNGLEAWLLSLCSKPSQPQRILSG